MAPCQRKSPYDTSFRSSTKLKFGVYFPSGVKLQDPQWSQISLNLIPQWSQNGEYFPPTDLSPSKIEDSRSHFSKASIPQKRFSEFPLYPRKVMKDSHSSQKLSEALLIPSTGQRFTFPDDNQRFHYLQLSGIYFPQQDSYSSYMHIHYIHIS